MILGSNRYLKHGTSVRGKPFRVNGENPGYGDNKMITGQEIYSLLILILPVHKWINYSGCKIWEACLMFSYLVSRLNSNQVYTKIIYMTKSPTTHWLSVLTLIRI